LIARNSIGKALADWGVVWLKRPWNKRYKTRIAVLQLAKPFEMHQSLIASLAHAEHHCRSSWDVHRVRDVHHVQPFFCVAMGATFAANLVDQNLATSPWYG